MSVALSEATLELWASSLRGFKVREHGCFSANPTAREAHAPTLIGWSFQEIRRTAAGVEGRWFMGNILD